MSRRATLGALAALCITGCALTMSPACDIECGATFRAEPAPGVPLQQPQLANEIRNIRTETLPAVAGALIATRPVQLPQPDKEPPELPPPIVTGDPSP